MKQLPAVRATLPSDPNSEVNQQSEVDALYVEIKKLTERRDSNDKKLHDIGMMLNSHCTDLMPQVADLEEKIRAFMESQEDFKDIDKQDLEELNEILGEDYGDDEGEDVVVEDAPEDKSEAAVRKDCTRLFRAIARLTHPDKVGNRLRDIFLEAKKALEAYDLDRLADILQTLTLRSAMSLTRRLEALRRKRNNLLAEVEAQEGDPRFMIQKLIDEMGLYQGIHVYRSAIKDRLDYLRSQYEALTGQKTSNPNDSLSTKPHYRTSRDFFGM